MLLWPRDKRWFYEGLIQLADDSGCLEDSPFSFKIELFPSPVDADITMEVMSTWVRELILAKKLVRYKAGEKSCLYLTKFKMHQSLKNPEKPSVPLPPWVTWEPHPSNPRAGKYVVSDDVLTEFLRSSDDVLPIELELELERELELESNNNNNKEEAGIAHPVVNEDFIRSVTPQRHAVAVGDDPYVVIPQEMSSGIGKRYRETPEDGQLITELIGNGITLEFIVDKMRSTFSDPKKKIHRFTYFGDLIKDAWAYELAKKSQPNVVDFESRWSVRTRDRPNRDPGIDMWEQSGTMFEENPLKYRPGNGPSIIGGD